MNQERLKSLQLSKKTKKGPDQRIQDIKSKKRKILKRDMVLIYKMKKEIEQKKGGLVIEEIDENNDKKLLKNFLKTGKIEFKHNRHPVRLYLATEDKLLSLSNLRQAIKAGAVKIKLFTFKNPPIQISAKINGKWHTVSVPSKNSPIDIEIQGISLGPEKKSANTTIKKRGGIVIEKVQQSSVNHLFDMRLRVRSKRSNKLIQTNVHFSPEGFLHSSYYLKNANFAKWSSNNLQEGNLTDTNVATMSSGKEKPSSAEFEAKRKKFLYTKFKTAIDRMVKKQLLYKFKYDLVIGKKGFSLQNILYGDRKWINTEYFDFNNFLQPPKFDTGNKITNIGNILKSNSNFELYLRQTTMRLKNRKAIEKITVGKNPVMCNLAVSQYGKIPNLPGVMKDAVLKSKAFNYLFKPSKIVEKKGRVTKQQMISAIKMAVTTAKLTKKPLVINYSGHGAISKDTNKDFFFAASETKNIVTGLSGKELLKLIKPVLDSNLKVTIMTDACHAGGIKIKHPRLTILAAVHKTQLATENATLGGFFTHKLCRQILNDRKKGIRRTIGWYFFNADKYIQGFGGSYQECEVQVGNQRLAVRDEFLKKIKAKVKQKIGYA
ncbi:caspase family protein [Patescibacteria group bacterium]|nr:caspase family protein [Patescibacteria group bacterium]